ncbi:MAG: hypothetical protein ABSA80_06750 [Terriglobales bacterium]
MAREEFNELAWPALFEEPERWRVLQEQALAEREPKKLEAIIKEMNDLLTGLEKRAAAQKR